MENCLFCKIVNNEISSYTIYEDDIVKAFLDINPTSVGHTLIVPKSHYLDLDDIPLEVLNRIMEVSKKVKRLIQERLNPDGMTLVQNNGLPQEVKHFHLHLKPAYSGKIAKANVEDVFNQIME